MYELSSAGLAGLPTNNIPGEREFSVFDRKTVGAKCRNNKFKAKSIRNDMTLHKSSTFSKTPTKSLKLKMKVLNASEEEIMYRPELFKLKKITHAERLDNLCILLAGTQSGFIDIPTNKDVNLILKANHNMSENELTE